MANHRPRSGGVLAVAVILLSVVPTSRAADAPPLIRSAPDGPWSAADTWEGGRAPAAGDRVQVRAGHAVVYDVAPDAAAGRAVRSVHVAGTLAFARDRDTRLDVGLIKVQPGTDASEDGFNCDAHPGPADAATRPALEVGTFGQPIPAGHTATIRLVYFDGMDRQTLPAVVNCGGRMDFHGAQLNRTWLKLDKPAKAGESDVTLEQPVNGWRPGDRVILTATIRQNKQAKTFRPSTRDNTQTEERTVRAVAGDRLTLDRPLKFDHACDGPYRGDVANLSRNVVIESADPATARGHTMYHRHSTGGIGYAEFRHLGKEGVLGKYPIHFHLAGDTMRGSSVVGASVWDSGNRWVTVHGTNYLVIRDCVGYQSAGHGYFFEDGTEVYNAVDRNLAVQAYIGKPLPDQVFPFDKNDGAGFWWANSLNSFTRNTAAECDEYGYFFQVTKADGFDVDLSVLQPDGTRKKTDVRTLPFVRFDDNESHCQRRHAFNLDGAPPDQRADAKRTVDGVGPDARHPFVIHNLRIWNTHWAFHPVSPSVLVDGLDIHHSEYGVWFPIYNHHAYHGLRLDDIKVSPEFNPTGPKPKADEYPKPLDPTDDLPPATVVTSVTAAGSGKVLVRGSTIDNDDVRRVTVNGQAAKATAANYAEWEAVLEGVGAGALEITAGAEDAAGNVERTPHVFRAGTAVRSGQ